MIATRSQKIRLAIFLIFSGCIFVFSMIYLVGSSLLEARDSYQVIFEGGSAGLELGGQVRFNGVSVGRIESVRLNPDNPSQAIINLSVDGGTPITEDTVAVPELAGVTGTKLLSLTGGTKSSKRLKPGSTIKSTESDFSLITTKITNISNKLEDLIDNLIELSNDTNAKKLEGILSELELSIQSINSLVTEQRGNIDETLTHVASITKKMDASMEYVNSVLHSTDSLIHKLSTKQNINHIVSTLANLDTSMSSIKDRVSAEELGQTIASVNKLSSDTHVAILRLRDDLRRTMKELDRGIENITEFTQILVDNPSALISGRREKDRELP